jgi:NAD(P)H-nitrite reductase large subunit
MFRYVIIGSGVTGLAAIEGIRSLDTDGKITVISDDPYGYYSRPGLAYYLTGELSEKQLYPKSNGDIQNLHVNWVNNRVQAIRPQDCSLLFQDGSRIEYDRLLLATGSQAGMVRMPGADLKGVVKLDTLQDAREILQRTRKTRRAVVVGGGITALEIVEGLSARRIKVHYLLRGDRYWKGVLDEIESRIVEERLKHDGVKIHYHTEIDTIEGKKGWVDGVVTKEGERIACGIVAVAIGVRPRKALAEAAGLKVDRGVLVRETLETSVPGIYAAGDAAQVYDPYTGRTILDTLWPTARQQGYTAGLNMAGQQTAYHKSVAYNVTRLAGITTTIIGSVGQGEDSDLVGIARGDSETWRFLPESIVVEKNFEVNRVRVLLGEDQIVGAVVMGDQTLSEPLYQLITEKVDIAPVRSMLAAPEHLQEAVITLWTQWRERHANEKL